MFWKTTCGEVAAAQNLLMSGTCACPGKVIGRVHVWDYDTENQLEEGYALILLDAAKELPIWAIRNSCGIISCAHTSYSHLTSIAMALNKPCIVGAVFTSLPKNSDTVLIDSQESIVAHVADYDINALRIGESEADWLTSIGSKVCKKLYSKRDNPLVHLLVLDGLEQYIDFISGLFFDSMIFQEQLHADTSDFTVNISKIHYCHPSISIYYRFSTNAIGRKDTKSQLEREIDFIWSLQNVEIPVNVFIPNVTTYNDIEVFRQFIACEFNTRIPIKIGAMLENKQIVDCLDSIVADDLIEFAVVGMNDLMSSCLNLERDDPRNQESFRIDAEPVSQALITIINTLTEKGIPCYIGYPKYSRFLIDYELLNDFGYSRFFGTHSHFVIAQKYGRS